jgi:hypothetical protein
MSENLSDFFNLIAEANKEKKKLREEEDKFISELIGANDIVENILLELTGREYEKEQQELVDNIIEEVEEEVKDINDVVRNIIKPEPQEDTRKYIKEGLLNIPSNEKTPDPLTPLNQNFVTLDQLQQHYKLFINRIQQQLSTLGGGGETKFRYLDDVVGLATNSSAYDSKFLQWNSTTNQAEFVDPNDAGGTAIVNISGITTYYQASNVDDYIGVNANVPVTIVLPQIPSYGKKLIVKDEGNKIATYNITVQAGAATSVENDSSVIMDINHQSFTYFYNGSNWFLI